MQIITKQQFLENNQYKLKILEGNIFIYPTDTIYGIGANAINDQAVQKIREIKQRDTNPFSIIAPTKEWIEQNCIVHQNAKEWIKRLPGPYTLILKTKNQSFSKQVNPQTETIGIRMPDNWFTKIAEELSIPITSTSANISGQPHMTSLETLNQEIKNKVDFIIDEGEKQGSPSAIIDLTDPLHVKEIKR